MDKKQTKSGFTLIEVIIVIAIIGLLISFISVNFASGNKKARDARRMADLEQVRAALQMYYSNSGYFPADGNGGWVTFGSSFLTGYIDKPPAEMFFTSGTSCSATTPALCPYKYKATNQYPVGTGNWYGYCLEARLELSTSTVTACSAESNYSYSVANP